MGVRIYELELVRALAIWLVLLFHLEVPGFDFGYLGVDLFFVLSGYLMTSTMLRDRERLGEFPIAQFFARRFWRLGPSFLIMALVTIFLCYLIFSPTHLKEAGEQLVRATTLTSNLHFYGQAGYFAPENEIRPFLHTWSLSVEEQFYVLFGLLLFLGKYVRFGVLIGLGLGVGLVLLFSAQMKAGGHLPQPLSMAFPPEEKLYDALFYQLPFRLFQFFGGGALVYFLPGLGIRLSRLHSAVLPTFSILLLICTTTLEMSVYSSLLAFFSAIILMLPNSYTSKLGQWRGIRYSAKISYQVYLVHWPLIVLWRYITLDELQWPEKFVLGILSLLVGSALWHVALSLNRDFQDSSVPLGFTRSKLWVPAVVITVVAGLAPWVAGGLPWRVSDQLTVISSGEHRGMESAYCQDSHLSEGRELGVRRGDPLVTCVGNADQAETLYVFGDSHARHLVPGLAINFPTYRIAVLYFTSCQAQSGIGDYTYRYNGRRELEEACVERNRNALQYFGEVQPAKIILHHWGGYPSDASDEFYESSSLLIEQLTRQGHAVKWIGSVIHPDKLLLECTEVPWTFPDAFLEHRCRGSENAAAMTMLKNDRLAQEFPEIFLNTNRFFCPSGKANGCRITIEGRSLFRDKHHLTVTGSSLLIKFALK